MMMVYFSVRHGRPGVAGFNGSAHSAGPVYGIFGLWDCLLRDVRCYIYFSTVFLVSGEVWRPLGRPLWHNSEAWKPLWATILVPI